jgi:hypothetical protein
VGIELVERSDDVSLSQVKDRVSVTKQINDLFTLVSA